MLNPDHLSMLAQVQIWCCTRSYFKKDTCILPGVHDSFLWGKEIHVANASMTCILGEARCGHICSSRWSHNEAEGSTTSTVCHCKWSSQCC